MQPEAFTLSRAEVNALARGCVFALEGCGMTRVDICARSGISEHVIKQMMSREDALPNPVALLSLFRLASVNGHDEAINRVSAPWKIARSILSADLNGSTTDEIVAAIENEGLARYHGERGEHISAYRLFDMAAAYLAKAGLEHLALAGYPVVVDPQQTSLFDYAR